MTTLAGGADAAGQLRARRARRCTPASRASSRATPTCRRWRRACSGRRGAAASAAQRQGFVAAFQHYLARQVRRSSSASTGTPASTSPARGTAARPGCWCNTGWCARARRTIAVDWQVSDRSGSARVVNLVIEGVSMLANERAEVGAMLEAPARQHRRADPGAAPGDLRLSAASAPAERGTTGGVCTHELSTNNCFRLISRSDFYLWETFARGWSIPALPWIPSGGLPR